MTSAPAAIHDIRLFRGYDFKTEITLENEADDGTITPLDLTGGDIAASAWDFERENKYADFLITYINKTAGLFKISLTNDQTLNFPDELYYDLRFENSVGDKNPYIRGKITTLQGYER